MTPMMHMTRRPTIRVKLPVLLAGLLLGVSAIFASPARLFSASAVQQDDQKPSQQQGSSSSKDTGESSSKDTGESSSNDTGKGAIVSPKDEKKADYDPLPAEKDVEVATYYLHKGDPDAAIPRLEEAIELQPKVAKPRLLLAEAYEKKKDPSSAIKYYREYLQVFPAAPDAKKIQKKIEDLSRK